jgi:hypothetical protein
MCCVYRILESIFIYFSSNLDQLGYLLATSSSSSSGRSSYYRTFYTYEAVEMTVAVNPVDACFAFAAGDATICLPLPKDIKDDVGF